MNAMFDFNKLDKYKKFMGEEGITEMKWELYTIKIYDKTKIYGKYILQMFSDFDDWWEVESDDWEEFKIEVANKFLGGNNE